MINKLGWIILIICVPLIGNAQESTNNLNPTKNIDSSRKKFLKKVKSLKVKKISDLVHLYPFSDVAVIQRRFMPKTGRMSFSTLSIFNLSSEFFFNPGLSGYFTYNFLEKHGIELSSYYLFTFQRGVTIDLANIEIKVSESTPIARSFIGVTYKWMPIYGKIALYNKSIFSFDTVFNIGIGTSGVKVQKQPLVWEPTGIFGIGQVFAITRDLGFRWNLRSHITYRISDVNSETKLLMDTLFSIGFSYYYPSAGLR